MVIRFPSKDDDDPKRRAMAKWIDEQRQAYRDGTLSQERIEKLEQLPGWMHLFVKHHVENEENLVLCQSRASQGDSRHRMNRQQLFLAEFSNRFGFVV